MRKKLLIADDEIDFSISLFNYIQSHNSNIEVVGISRDGEETIKKVIELNPDILLLDLKMPKKTGIDVIAYIQSTKKISNIEIIIISAEATLINKSNVLKTNFVKYVFIKPFKFEEMGEIIDKLSINYKNYIDNLIDNILNQFNFNTSSIAYKYLICCIEKATERPYLLSNIEKLLYDEVSKEFDHVSRNQVKWDIQKLIKSMNRYTKTNTMKELFPNYNNPSPKIFIQTISEMIRKLY
ncbi:MAG: response regulator [Clostridia bacterium]|nr:response regulator [Clostridia bacterium]